VERLIRLDTHVVVWLYAGEIERLGEAAAAAIEEHAPTISPMVRLELTYLHEVGRITVPAADIIDDLTQRVSLTMSTTSLAEVVRAATPLDWTRDPFDRLITADALASAASLVTKDEHIRANVPTAIW
jgi:PIN domain nuclease of toxin-antitoxin system